LKTQEITMLNSKIRKIFALTLLSALLLLSIASVSAQGQASVTVLDVLGGTTDPSGTNSYDAGTAVMLTATAIAGYEFTSWQIVTATSTIVATDNPYTFTVAAGETYAVQPIFDVIQSVPGSLPPTDFSTAALVGVLTSAGGTTDPPPGSYALANAENFDLKAIPNSGWQFSHWIISGPTDTSHGGTPFTLTPTNNPYNVNHGYGYKYYYQAVFTPVGTTEPTPAGQTPTPAPGIGGMTTETGIIIALVVVIIIILIAFGIFAMRKKK
jgi:hypothetical protein